MNKNWSEMNLPERFAYCLCILALVFIAVAFAHRTVTAQGLPLTTASIETADETPAVDEQIAISWTSSGATTVSVTRDGTQISSLPSGSTTFTPTSRQPTVFAITAVTPQDTVTQQLTIRPQTFNSLAGMVGNTPGGVWVAQLTVMLFAAGGTVFLGRFRPTAFVVAIIAMPVAAFAMAVLGVGSYWLATITVILTGLAGLMWAVAMRPS